jgi:hypothetical protein
MTVTVTRHLPLIGLTIAVLAMIGFGIWRRQAPRPNGQAALSATTATTYRSADGELRITPEQGTLMVSRSGRSRLVYSVPMAYATERAQLETITTTTDGFTCDVLVPDGEDTIRYALEYRQTADQKGSSIERKSTIRRFGLIIREDVETSRQDLANMARVRALADHPSSP